MATKKIFLVDTENVGSTWKDLLPVKAGSDQILLFFTENSPYMSYTDLQLILQFPDRFEMIKCNPGKNGLDFQLVSYLGYLMKTASKANYVIVSNDAGFDAVVKFWQDRGMSVSRMNVYHVLQPDAAKTPETVPAPAPAKPESPKNRRGRPANSARRRAVKNGGQTTGGSTTNISFPKQEADAKNPEQGTGPIATTAAKNDSSAKVSAPEQDSDAVNGDAGKTGTNPPQEDTGSSAANAVVPDHMSGAGSENNDQKYAGTQNGTAGRTEAADGDAECTGTQNGGTEHAETGGLTANTDTLPETEIAVPKTKSGKTAKATPRKKAAASADTSADTAAPAKTSTAKAPAKRQRKTASAPLSQPVPSAASDSENIELDFSSLTVAEKASLLRKYLPKEFSENQESLDIISDIMFGHDTTNHHQLHLAFVKNFGDEKGTQIYKAFRPHLAEFRA